LVHDGQDEASRIADHGRVVAIVHMGILVGMQQRLLLDVVNLIHIHLFPIPLTVVA
jgi:hypothetical protein